MAIQTQGSVVRQMPVYTAPNPSLVAFTPQPVISGMGDAFRLAQQLEQLKASKALQAELAATREGRIAQQNALANLDVSRVGTELPMLAPRAALELGQIGNKQALLGPELSARQSTLALEGARASAAFPNVVPESMLQAGRTAADLSLLSPVTEAARAQAAAQAATAGNVTALAPSALRTSQAELASRETQAKSDVALSTLKQNSQAAQLQLAEQLAQLQAAGAAPEAMLKALRVGQELGSAKTDQEFRETVRKVDLELKKSQIKQNEAQAAYAMGLGRQALGAAGLTPERRAAQLQDLIRELDSMKVGDGRRTLGVYLEDTFNKDGTVKGERFFGAQRNQTRDPVADQYLLLRSAYQNELSSLLPQITRSPSANAPAGSAGLPAINQVVNGYRYLGGNPKDKNAWEKVK